MLHIVLLSLFFSLSLSATCPNSVVPGSITWTNQGSSNTGYIIQAGGTGSGEWGKVTTSGSQVTSSLGPRFYLANTCAAAFSPPTMFEKLNQLIGGTIQFTVNLSGVGCGCDAAFYLVGMPSSAAGSNGDYYCDANCVGGSCCTEMDLMEANTAALQITPHMCTSATGGCDAGGCTRNTQSITNGYGSGSQYTINTQNSFTVSITFHETSSQLSSITSVISQGSKSITMTHDSTCGSGYLQGMTSAFQTGLVPVWSVWAGSMGWLDSPACSSSVTCSTANFIVSGLTVTAGSSTAPPTAPPKAPTAAPKAPTAAPTSSTSGTCGTNGCTINAYWVEWTPPSSFSGTPPSTASVLCSGTTTVSCTWYSAGNKYQCSPGSTQCTNPIPIWEGKQCPFATPQAIIGDQTASDGGLLLSTGAIAGIAGGSVVLVIVLIVIIVLVVKKKPTEEYA